jgi:hypothetical protein
VAVHGEDEQMVAWSVAARFRRLEQGRDLGLGEEVLGPLVRVGGRRAVTFDNSPRGRARRHGSKSLIVQAAARTTFDERHLCKE